MIFTIDKLIELLEKNKNAVIEYDIGTGVNGKDGFVTKVKIKIRGDVLHNTPFEKTDDNLGPCIYCKDLVFKNDEWILAHEGYHVSHKVCDNKYEYGSSLI